MKYAVTLPSNRTEMIQTKAILESFLRLLYLINPTSSSFEKIEEVPNYVREAAPFFIGFIILEWIILYVKRGKHLPPLNDGITSMAHGLFLEVGRIMFRGAETATYVYIYNAFHIFDVKWNSPVTWFMAAIGVDFAYYWAHRAVHEINLFWSQHQVHHSSEEYNFTTALRQGMFQRWFVIGIYIPMALFIPPSHFLVHLQLNQISQFWIHTELIKDLGPLELILNTPSHHRVHHGSNRYCVDKNYGGVLIIWDKLFGTFAAERKDEPVVYGLIEQVNSFNPLYLQVFYLAKIYGKFRSVEGFWSKVSAVFKGPGWFPGSPWTGYHHLLPDLKLRTKYQQAISINLMIYLVVQFVLVAGGYLVLGANKTLNTFESWIFCLYLLFSLTSIGGVFDNRRWSLVTEFIRCALFSLYPLFAGTSWPVMMLCIVLRLFSTCCALFWFFQLFQAHSLGHRSIKNARCP